MEITDAVVSYRRYLKRRNYSPHTIKNYLNRLKHFVLWVDVPLEEVEHGKVLSYLDWLMGKRLTPTTINCHLFCISGFYEYLHYEQGKKIKNPVKKSFTLRLHKPLPRSLKDDEISLFFKVVKSYRDRAIFMLMLRCGLRVEETAHLMLPAIDLKRRSLMVVQGKGGKSRVVYLSKDAYDALVAYLTVRKASRTQGLFLVEKGVCKGQPISVRGIQKRMEYYARTTQRYCKVSNMKVKRDYYKAMEIVMTRTTPDWGR
jgi:site-specific recombinase XerD